MNLIGDVRGKVAVMVDDMIDTAGITVFLMQTLLIKFYCINLVVRTFTFYHEL